MQTRVRGKIGNENAVFHGTNIDNNKKEIIVLRRLSLCKKEMVRVRFAPSPTGPLHIGGLRTALFNYLYAKKHQGAFVLRVEDTDQKRKVEGSEEYIENCLAWCGLSPDESPNKGGKYGPYRQSERGQIYKNFINQLIDSDRAYYAFDTPEELDALRSTAEINNDRFMYLSLIHI